MLEQDLPLEIKESIADSLRATNRIQLLIEDFLGFSKKNGSNNQLIAINNLTSQALTLLNVKAARAGVKIGVDLDKNLPDIFFDKNKLLQVLLNLMTNAIESCRDDGKVLVRTYQKQFNEKKLVVWEIEDNGVGISDVDKDNIFSDFYTNKSNGTGLGLSVCRRLLEEFNTTLDFESKDGFGTKFFISFDIDYLLKLKNDTQDINNR
jgi:signal transduction histidine kinase